MSNEQWDALMEIFPWNDSLKKQATCRLLYKIFKEYFLWDLHFSCNWRHATWQSQDLCWFTSDVSIFINFNFVSAFFMVSFKMNIWRNDINTSFKELHQKGTIGWSIWYPLKNLFNLLETNSKNFISGSLTGSFKMVNDLPYGFHDLGNAMRYFKNLT